MNEGRIKYGKADLLQEYLDQSRVLGVNCHVSEKFGNNSNVGNKIDNYLKGGEWSDEELLIRTDDENDELSLNSLCLFYYF